MVEKKISSPDTPFLDPVTGSSRVAGPDLGFDGLCHQRLPEPHHGNARVGAALAMPAHRSRMPRRVCSSVSALAHAAQRFVTDLDLCCSCSGPVSVIGKEPAKPRREEVWPRRQPGARSNTGSASQPVCSVGDAGRPRRQHTGSRSTSPPDAERSASNEKLIVKLGHIRCLQHCWRQGLERACSSVSLEAGAPRRLIKPHFIKKTLSEHHGGVDEWIALRQKPGDRSLVDRKLFLEKNLSCRIDFLGPSPNHA